MITGARFADLSDVISIVKIICLLDLKRRVSERVVDLLVFGLCLPVRKQTGANLYILRVGILNEVLSGLLRDELLHNLASVATITSSERARISESMYNPRFLHTLATSR